MQVEPRVARRDSLYGRETSTTDWLANARRQADALGLDDYFVVDVDSHREPNSYWSEVLEYMENPVMRADSQRMFDAVRARLYVPGDQGFVFQGLHGRIPHAGTTAGSTEPTGLEGPERDVELCRRAMNALSVDVQVVFPTSLLNLGMSPIVEGEAQIAYAYNRWMVERFCALEPRIKFLPFLPLRDPEMSLRIVRELVGKTGVVGFMITGQRHEAVHSNSYMRIYAEIEDAGYPLAFHAGPTWNDEWMRTTNRFLSMHAISFVHCSIVHMTNWVINGLPERFPRLKVIWTESGLAWVPFLMQRLDHEYMKRTSEAPLLKRPPSEYMREMYYSSQPMEMDNLELLEATMKAVNAETQVLYASDWPHWDFDLPGSILRFPFLSDQAKRNILGLNAARVFNLEVPA
jgi:predicted TIM-barrel fold metal-dependent hydrolase